MWDLCVVDITYLFDVMWDGIMHTFSNLHWDCVQAVAVVSQSHQDVAATYWLFKQSRANFKAIFMKITVFEQIYVITFICTSQRYLDLLCQSLASVNTAQFLCVNLRASQQ
ncbi:hypothetical protein NP493_829g01077 [Ridgeia piscesae]|uniref:Uncharacterized protein n=1 Tax=Ridgeia piscesae TaxID=27915 RepID=A0AAD9KMZ4_RIDPI|nr:hypothetical protein NP493_829g01077 [Ridgeia piscesae]